MKESIFNSIEGNTSPIFNMEWGYTENIPGHPLLPRKCPCDIHYKKGGNQNIPILWLSHTAARMTFKKLIDNGIFSKLIFLTSS